MHHPDDGELLRYADGELPARQTRRVRRHLEACWRCRAELQRIQEAVGECVRYREEMLVRYAPPPPDPWPDIYRGFADIDATPGNTSWGDVLRGFLQLPARHARRWVPAAVMLVLAVVGYYRFRGAPPVEAAELLNRAVVAARNAPQPERRVRIRSSRHEVTRTVRSARLAGVAPPGELAVLLAAAHIDWDDPLNPRSFQAWREQLPEKYDEVETTPGFYRIRTSTPSGEVAAATLKLRTQDLHPLEERIDFRSREWVEISELPPETPSQVQPPVMVATARPPVSAANSPLPAPAIMAGIGDELHAIAALHRVGADLGDPVEVTRSGGEVVVRGVGLAEDRQRQIFDAVGSLPRVVVRFSEPEQPGLPAHAAPGEVETSRLPSRPPAELERLAGGRAQFERLSAQLLDLNEAMMARAYALHRLAARFPYETETRLNTEDRRLLRQMAEAHAAMFSREAESMHRILSPWVSGASPPRLEADESAGPWQPAARELFERARRVDRLLAVTLGGATGESPSAASPTHLMEHLNRVRAAASRCAHRASLWPGDPRQ